MKITSDNVVVQQSSNKTKHQIVFLVRFTKNNNPKSRTENVWLPKKWDLANAIRSVSLLTLLTISLTGRDISPSCLPLPQKNVIIVHCLKPFFCDMVYFYSPMLEIFLIFLIKHRKLYLYNNNPFINGVI